MVTNTIPVQLQIMEGYFPARDDMVMMSLISPTIAGLCSSQETIIAEKVGSGGADHWQLGFPVG